MLKWFQKTVSGPYNDETLNLLLREQLVFNLKWLGQEDTPLRTPGISGLKYQILKPTFLSSDGVK